MKKTILILFMCAALVLCFTGCGEDVVLNVNVEDSGTIDGNIFGISALTEIGGGLWYDRTTGIVYWWNGITQTNYANIAPSPYYAPNGLPYRYNPQTNAFVEVKIRVLN